MKSNVPNLDKMNRSELMEFWARHQRGRNARDLFPDGGTGTRKATGLLAGYASNRAAMLLCRNLADKQREQIYGRICSNIRLDLPIWALFGE